MNDLVVVGVEVADHGESEGPDDSKPKHSVIGAIVSDSVEYFVPASNAGLMASEHEETRGKAEDSIPHWEADYIGDKWEMVISASNVAVVACGYQVESDI